MTPIRKLSLLAAAVALLLPVASQAASIPNLVTLEAGMDTIYSQVPPFGAGPLDIRFNAPVNVNNASLLTIDTQTKLDAAFALFGGPAGGPTIYMIFVDDVDWCASSFNTSYVGCAELPGNHMVVESVFMASSLGDELGAHELGHNLGLEHDSPGNLMNATIGATHTLLTGTQHTTLMASTRVQADAFPPFTSFVSITPVLIIPEPSLVSLVLLAGATLAWSHRRR